MPLPPALMQVLLCKEKVKNFIKPGAKHSWTANKMLEVSGDGKPKKVKDHLADQIDRISREGTDQRLEVSASSSLGRELCMPRDVVSSACPGMFETRGSYEQVVGWDLKAGPCPGDLGP